MFSFIRNHPFAVDAYFDSSLVFTFAIPKEAIQHLIPACLELDTFNDQWAFIAVAMVDTRELRPKGFPKFMGNRFFLIGYRVFVRYTNNQGKHLRGLYILKSETDSRKMELMGNIFTHYHYKTTDINQQREDETIIIHSRQSDFRVQIDNAGNEKVSLPAGSPFTGWKDARKFAGPLPFTFSYNPKNHRVLIIEGVRENWKPVPVEVMQFHFSYLDSLRLYGIRLANAFIIRNIPYSWKKGKTEQWKG